MLNKLFVYGTLKRGFGNHGFLSDAKFISEVKTVDKFIMYEQGIPFLSKDEEKYQVTGELFELDDFRNVDSLEGHPNSYKREVIKVYDSETNTEHEAWAYFYPHDLSDTHVNEDGVYKRNNY